MTRAGDTGRHGEGVQSGAVNFGDVARVPSDIPSGLPSRGSGRVTLRGGVSSPVCRLGSLR